MGSSVDEILIILWHEDDLIRNLIEKNKKIKVFYNKDYKSGVSSSIKMGVKNISLRTDAFFISLGDMPNVNQNIYNKLIKARSNYNKKLKTEFKKEIIIPTYEGKNGNPILFSKFMKKKIENISGDFGAKKIVELNKEKILNVKFKSNSVVSDFDTKDDFRIYNVWKPTPVLG